MSKFSSDEEKLKRKSLLNYLQSEIDLRTNRKPKHELKYVLYARKSSEEKDKQEHSIEDQISECKKFAKIQGLKIVEVVTEEKSAKTSNNRPKFLKLIEDFENETSNYDGIISWHPNRLSRNMLEAGRIIDLLDSGKIQDLKFASFTFNNDSSGKLLLSITFAMAKEYSDNLSTNVIRGKESNLERGQIADLRIHGYIQNENNFLIPDPTNFNLVKNAFKMRLERATLDEVGKYLHENNFKQFVRTHDKKQKDKIIF